MNCVYVCVVHMCVYLCVSRFDDFFSWRPLFFCTIGLYYAITVDWIGLLGTLYNIGMDMLRTTEKYYASKERLFISLRISN